MKKMQRDIRRRRYRFQRVPVKAVVAAGLCALFLCGCRNRDDLERIKSPETELELGSGAADTGMSEAGPYQTDAQETDSGSDTPDYILPDSDRRLIGLEDIKALTPDLIRLARNEIYARRGRGFQSEELQEYFDRKPWYVRTVEAGDFNDSILNEYEKANIRYLKKLEPAEGLAGLLEAPSKDIIDRYGYERGHSALSFGLKPGTAKDCGDYYQVDAIFGQGIEAPGDLEIGERVTLVFDELTGETKTLERRESGLYPVGEGKYASEYYYRPSADGSPVVLYEASDDRVDKQVCEGTIFVRKDATVEIDIERQSEPVTLFRLNEEYNWFNGIFFDRKGYAVRLVFYGD